MKIGIIFGGRSSEHDISIITGVMAINAASIKHKVVPIYIDNDGVWYTSRRFNDIKVFSGVRHKRKRVHLIPASPYLYTSFNRKIVKLDAVINCCHGSFGEDGCLSGLLELCGIPYAGSNVLASSIGMDKLIQKKLFLSEGINVVPFIGITKDELEDGFYKVIKKVNENLTFPLIVKPRSLGSSIGIGLASDFKELFIRLDEAFMWDNRVIVENALTDFIEVNCAVLGFNDKLIASQIEQPLSSGFLSFEDKYESGGKLGGYDKSRYQGYKDSAIKDGGESEDVKGYGEAGNGEYQPIGKGEMGRFLPAHISPEMAEEVRALAKDVFSLLGCSAVARVDFLIKDDKLFVNEINTVPGSLSSYLFAFDGMDFPLLIDKLLSTAIMQYEDKKSLKYTFKSNVLKGDGRIKK